MYLNGNPVQTITNITALTKLSTSTTVGYILPYLSSNIGSVNKNLNFSPLAPDKLKMIITVFNIFKRPKEEEQIGFFIFILFYLLGVSW